MCMHTYIYVYDTRVSSGRDVRAGYTQMKVCGRFNTAIRFSLISLSLSLSLPLIISRCTQNSCKILFTVCLSQLNRCDHDKVFVRTLSRLYGLSRSTGDLAAPPLCSSPIPGFTPFHPHSQCVHWPMTVRDTSSYVLVSL